MVKIFVAHIGSGELNLEQDQTANDLDLSIEQVQFIKPLHIKCAVTQSGSSIFIHGQVTGQTELTCSRCLEQFQGELNEKFEHYHKWEGEPEVDITDQIREAVILSFSMKMLCQAECKGLCPFCGQNLNLKKCGCKPPAGGSIGNKIKDIGGKCGSTKKKTF